MHPAPLHGTRHIAHRLGDFLASAAVGDQDGRRICPISGFQKPRAQAGRHIIHRTVDLVGTPGGDQDGGGLKHARGLFVDVAAVRAPRLELLDLLATTAARHPATTRGTLGFSFAVPDSSPTLSSTIWINPSAALDNALSL